MEGLLKVDFQLFLPRTMSFNTEMNFSSSSMVVLWGFWNVDIALGLEVGFDEKGRKRRRRRRLRRRCFICADGRAVSPFLRDLAKKASFRVSFS